MCLVYYFQLWLALYNRTVLTLLTHVTTYRPSLVSATGSHTVFTLSQSIFNYIPVQFNIGIYNKSIRLQPISREKMTHISSDLDFKKLRCKYVFSNLIFSFFYLIGSYYIIYMIWKYFISAIRSDSRQFRYIQIGNYL